MDSFVAIISLAVTTMLSLGLFVWQLIANQKNARHEANERALGQVIDTLTVVVRRLDQPVFLRPWFKPELEFALVVPRLILRLAKADAVVGKWATQQVQLAQQARSDRDAAQIGIAMTGALTEWHNGTRQRSWFAEHLEVDPISGSGRVRAQFRRQLSRLGEQLLAACGLVIGVLIIALGAGLGLRATSPGVRGRSG